MTRRVKDSAELRRKRYAWICNWLDRTDYHGLQKGEKSAIKQCHED